MGRGPEDPLSRREREILDIVYARGSATAAEVRAALAEPPSYSAVRGLIRVLEEKGLVAHTREGVRNVYHPTRSHTSAGRSALRRALRTYFAGDVRQAMRALIDVGGEELGEDDVERLRGWIDEAREEGR